MSTNSLKELVDAIKAQGKSLASGEAPAASGNDASARDLVYLSTAVERIFGADALLEMIDTATKPAEVITFPSTTTSYVLTDEQISRTIVKFSVSAGIFFSSDVVVTAPTKGCAFVIDNSLPTAIKVKTLGQTANIPSIPANTTGWVFCDGTNYDHVIDTAAIAQAVTTPMTAAGDMMYKEGVSSASVVQHTVHVRNYGSESYYYIKPQSPEGGGVHSGYDKSPTLPMQPSITYIFDVSDTSNSGQIFSFSTTSDGTHNSGTDLSSFDATSTVHVTRSGTEGSSGATVTVVMPATPNVTTLHYYSRGTDSATLDTIGLGGQINVLTSTAVTRLPIGNYGDTIGIDKYTGKPVWKDWGSNENRKVAALARDTTGIWSGGRYKFANHITGSTGSAGDASYIYASDVGTYDQTATGWSTYNHSSAIVYNRGKLEGTTWGSATEGSNGKSYNGDSIWEVNGYAKNGVGQGGFGKDDNEVFSDVIQTVSHYSVTMQLLANGELYITGHGDEGQQADGANVDRNYFHKVNFPSNAGRVRYIVSNSSTNGETAISCMVLMEDGDLYSWGYGVNGSLGLGNVTNYNTVQKVSYFDKNVKSCHMSGGNYSSVVAITNDNKLHTWGYNGYGQLGKGNTTTIYNGPAEIEVSGQIPVKALMTGSGSYGTLCVLMRSGRVYMCGHNNTGQLGNGNLTNQSTLIQVGGGLGVDTNKHVIDIFPRGTYGNNTWFLLEDGSMYACGQNALGIHGRGSTTANVSTPAAVSSNLTWVSEIIAPHGENGGYFQNMFIVHKTKEDRMARKNGWVYMTGHQVLSIGFWNFPSPVSTPTPPQLPNGVNGTIIMGSVSGYTGHGTGHSAAWQVLDQYGDMYQWGYDISQQIGGEGNRNIPIKRIQ